MAGALSSTLETLETTAMFAATRPHPFTSSGEFATGLRGETEPSEIVAA